MIDLAANLREAYGTWEKYQQAISNLPKAIQIGLATPVSKGGFAIAPHILEAFKNSEISSEVDSSSIEADSMGSASVAEIISSPAWLRASEKGLRWVGDRAPSQNQVRSLLYNPYPSKLAKDRPEALRRYILEILVPVLSGEESPRKKLIRRWVKDVRGGANIGIGVMPVDVHGDAIALVIDRLAAKVPAKVVIEELRSLIPANQAKLFGNNDEF